jgi:ribosomal-protein-alanine N-acetyltransferase
VRPIGTSVTVSAMPPLRVMGRSGLSRMPVRLRSSNSRADVPCVRDTFPMGDLVPPDPPLAGGRAALRPFRVSDAAAISESCRDPDIPRFTMMPEAMTEDQARHWVERGLEWWPRGLARFAVTVPPSDECAGQIGIQFDFAARRAEAFYWLDRRVRGRGIAVEALSLVTEWAFRDFGIVRVQLVTHLDNERSQRVAERCGFSREGVLRAWEPVKDEQPESSCGAASSTTQRRISVTHSGTYERKRSSHNVHLNGAPGLSPIARFRDQSQTPDRPAPNARWAQGTVPLIPKYSSFREPCRIRRSRR